MSNSHQFSGFSPAALDFLRQLEANNNRDWFEAHKDIYQNEIVAHAPAFVSALGERLKSISPAIEYDARTTGAGSMMRIYRDIRFSKDKTPYKTRIAFVFWQGPLKKMENPAFGFQFNANDGELMAGQFGFSKEMLTSYRNAVLDERLGNELLTILRSISQAGAYQIGGETSKRVPTGYDANHPRAELLRYQGLYAQIGGIPAEVLTSPTLVDVLFEHFRAISPLQQWLVRLAGG